MLHPKLTNPLSIAIIGGSNNIHKPGGNLVNNLKTSRFDGSVHIVNPNETIVQGYKCIHNLSDLPDIDLAIVAIPASSCPEVIDYLANHKNTKGFIIVSAGFSESGAEGADLEKKIVKIVNNKGGSLIGPNCIGVITGKYCGVFTSPVPHLHQDGCDLISASGATAVFIIESAISKGLRFSNIYTVGNAAQTTIEDVLEHFDDTFNANISSKVKLLYLESIKYPDKLLKHASSLIRKGCRIAAIKSGTSEAGSRAALSHTGAFATSDLAVEALFRKAGIIRCFGREELTTVASVLMHKKLNGKRIAIITHAGGPAVMLTDALNEGGLEIPCIEGPDSAELLKLLPQGSTVKNPIDFLATGNAQHLESVIEFCDKKFDNIDAMIVIFGSTGLSKVFAAYEVLHKKMLTCIKPIFPILPSILTAHSEVDTFVSKGHIFFPDEVKLGNAITKVHNTPSPAQEEIYLDGINIKNSRNLIEQASEGFQSNDFNLRLLKTAGIPYIPGIEVTDEKELLLNAHKIGFPLAMKVIGYVHKTDVKGVTLNIVNDNKLVTEYKRMMCIGHSTGVYLQPMIQGTELFVGAKYEPTFGHIIFCGLGGIFVEVLGDVASGLAPLTFDEAYSMIRSLKGYKIIKGIRGQKGLPEDEYANIIVRFSSLLRYAVEIKEADLNPLIANENGIFVVDAKINIQKK